MHVSSIILKGSNRLISNFFKFGRRVHYKEGRGPEYRERVDYHMVPRGTPHSISPSPLPPDPREREYYRSGGSSKYEKKHKRPSREVIVERIPTSAKAWREEEAPPMERGRGDEWADPWMRHKSPGSLRRRHGTSSSRRSRKQSYSSGSSYSSSRFVWQTLINRLLCFFLVMFFGYPSIFLFLHAIKGLLSLAFLSIRLCT